MSLCCWCYSNGENAWSCGDCCHRCGCATCLEDRSSTSPYPEASLSQLRPLRLPLHPHHHHRRTSKSSHAASRSTTGRCLWSQSSLARRSASGDEMSMWRSATSSPLIVLELCGIPMGPVSSPMPAQVPPSPGQLRR